MHGVRHLIYICISDLHMYIYVNMTYLANVLVTTVITGVKINRFITSIIKWRS